MAIKESMTKKPSRKTLINNLDILVSKVVRARDIAVYGKCPFCRRNDITDAFHFVSRTKQIVRWDMELNLVGSCNPCNGKYSGTPWGGKHQIPFWRWYIQHLGLEKFHALEEKSRQIADYSRPDLEEMLAGFREKYPY